MSLTVNQTLTLTAAALGTPAPNFHWYKDDEEIFIRENLKIQTTSNGSQLIIDGQLIRSNAMFTHPHYRLFACFRKAGSIKKPFGGAEVFFTSSMNRWRNLDIIVNKNS